MLTLAIRPSRWLQHASWLLTGLTVAALMLVALPPWLQGLGLAPLLLATLRSKGQGAMQLQCQADGRLSLLQTGKGWQPVALLSGSIVNPWLTTIRYRSETGKQVGTLVLLPDSLDAEDFRRLRVWLKWEAVIVAHAWRWKMRGASGGY